MYKYDKWLLAVTVLLITFGTIMILSSTSVVTPVRQKMNITELAFFKKHLVTMLMGTLIMMGLYRVSPDTFRKYSIPIMIVAFGLLICIFVPGIGMKVNGARRWLNLRVTTFQPSEFAKLAMVIFLAKYLSSPSYNTESFKSFIIPVGVMVAFQGMFLLQPDFGATMSLAFITMGMLFLSGTRLAFIGYLMPLAIPVIVKLAMEPYRLKRLTTFLNPWEQASGSGFQLVQSFIALGSGGLTGVGLGKSRQKLDFLPEAHTDFIFSVVGEELGFVIAVVVVGLYAFLFIRGIRIAQRNDDKFSYYLAFGLSIMIGLQAMVNFCVVTGMLPTKGLPLPFLSYGGSSLLINMAAVGILLNLSRARHKPFSKHDGAGELPADRLMRNKARRRSIARAEP